MILVTGATGKIGTEVVRLLAKEGTAARLFVRDPAKAKDWSGIEVVRGDLDDVTAVAAALAGIDTVFLLTVANPKQEFGVIQASKEAGVKKIVKISSMGAALDAPFSLARGHAQSEEQIKNSGLAWVILRPGFFTQNFLSFAATIRDQGRFFASVKDGRIALIDVRDIAEVAVQGLISNRHDGKTYILTGAETISYPEAASKLSLALGKPVSYVDVPLEETRKGFVAAGLPEWLTADMVTLQKSIAAGEVANISEDFERVTGHKPRTFDEFARDYASFFK